MNRIDIDRHTDITDTVVETLSRWLADEAAQRAWTTADAVLLEPGDAPTRMRRSELGDWLRANGMSSLARRLERLLVKPGTVAALIVSDEGARLRALPLPSGDDDREPVGGAGSAALLARFGGAA